MTQDFIKRNGVPWGERVLGWLRFCGFCGRAWGDIDIYCERCWRELWELKKPKIAILPRGQIHFSLFSWKKNLRVKNLVYNLKRGKCQRGFKVLAEEFSIEFNKSIGTKNTDFVFVPAPAKKDCPHDHAYELARALAEVWEGEIWCPLQRQEEKSQKQKSKFERYKVEYQFCSSNKPSRLAAKTIVFVDDVLTTGSSAKAALLHLEIFSKTMVWTLVHRPLLRK